MYWGEKVTACWSKICHRLDQLSLSKFIVINLILYFFLFIPACLEKKVGFIAKLLHQDKSHYLLRFFYMSALALLEGITFSIILAGLYALFHYFYTRRGISLSGKKIVGISLLFAFLVLWLKPFMSEDILFYIVRGRVESIYGKNPYTVSYSQFPNDKFYNISDYESHKELTSVYGPLVGHISQLLTRINKSSTDANVLIFKLFNVFLYLINAWLIIQIISHGAGGSQPFDSKEFLFYCWHPLIILELLLNGHNDMLVVSFFLMLVVSIKKDKPNLAIIFLTLGILTKITPLILFPHYMIYSLKNHGQKKHGYPALIMALAISFGLTIIISFPYLNTLTAVHGFSVHSDSLNLFQTLIRGFLELPAFFSDALSKQAAKLISYAIFLPFYSRKLFQLWRDPTERNLFRSSVYTLVLFMILVNPKYATWYLAWIIPFLIPLKDKRFSTLFTVWSFSSLLSYAPIFVFRKYYYGGGPLKVLFDLAIIYGLPFLYYFCQRGKACSESVQNETQDLPIILKISKPVLK